MTRPLLDRSHRSGLAALAALLGLLAATPTSAQAPDSAAERPLVRGGIYDKPYLTSLGGRAALGGYAEAHAVWIREDGVTEDGGFVAKRFNLFTAARVSDLVRIGAELEFEEGGEEIKVEFAAIDVLLHPMAGLRAGMLLSPLGRFNLAHDSPLNPFTDRPLVSTELLGVALSEPGLGFFGAVPVGGKGRLTYEAYGTNGFHEGLLYDAEDGTRLAHGRGNFEDNNASPAFVGRVTYSPLLALEIGIAAHHGAFNVFEEDGLVIDRRRNVTIWVLDAEVEAAGFLLSGEAATVRVGLPEGLLGVFAARQRGAYLDVVRRFGNGWVRAAPRSFFSTGVRLDGVDFDADRDGDSVHRLTFGLNFHPTSETVLKLDFLRGRARDRFDTPAEHAGIQFSVATYF